MKPRAIGIVAGGGGPIGSSAIFREVISECQKQFGSWRSYEYPCMNVYSFPYSEIMLVNHNLSSIPSRELSYCIQQLKLLGMEIIVIPCFTMSSYLTYRNYGVELIEMGTVIHFHLEKHQIKNPLVICSARTRNSGYCDKHFECHYPHPSIQQEVNALIEVALRGEKVDLRPLLDRFPDVPILCAMTTLNAQMCPEIDDERWINPNKILAKYIVHRSYEGDSSGNDHGFFEIQREAAMIGY
jgi:aspartate/glutamate racemase